MTNLIDVHIVKGLNENPEWWEQCKDSLKNHPINIHIVDKIDGDIRAARYNGFLQGTAPYVSFVDPDDYVLPETFDKCLEIIQNSSNNICGVYTMSQRLKMKNNKIRALKKYQPWNIELMKYPTTVHQIVVYKREPLLQTFIKYYDDIDPFILSEYKLHCLMSMQYKWIAIDHIGYVWRDHSNGIHTTFSKSTNNVTYNKIRQQCKEMIKQRKNYCGAGGPPNSSSEYPTK